jgi:putative ABC transport system permease protein
MIDSVLLDVRHALRLLRLNPGFAAVAVLSLALGAGANTAIFQLFDAIRLRTLPVGAPQELVELRVDDMTHARGTWLRTPSLSNPLWEQIRRHDEAFSGLFAWADEPLEISTSGELRRVAALWVSGDFFRVLGVQPILGRVFGANDDRRGCGQEAGVVLGYGFWQREFGGDPSVVGKPASIGRYRVEVIGVTPPAFFGMEVGRTFDLAMPICAEPAWHASSARLDAGTMWWLTVMGRLRRGISIERAGALVRASSAAIFDSTLPPGYPALSIKPYLAMTLVAMPALNGVSRLREQYSRPLVLLLAMTGLVLLIACANLAHLMLARSSARRREMAVRVAIGASGLRLARQLLIESLLLATAGVVAGLLLARALSRYLVSYLATDGASVFLDLSLDVRTFAFAAGLSVLTCLVFASVPVLRAAGTQPSAALIAWGRATSGRERVATGRMLLASQIALALALLAGTLLFARSLRSLETLDAGFQQSGMVIASVSFTNLKLPPDRAPGFRREILERVRATPSVEAAAEVVIVPLAGGNWNNRVWMEGSDADHARVAFRNMVGTDYFRTLRTPLMAGREFSEHDLAASSSRVAIVNEAFARGFSSGPEIVGRRVWLETTPSEPSAAYEIVGLARDAKYRDLREDFQPVLYVPMSQAALKTTGDQIVIRSSARSEALVSSVRSTLDGVSPQIRYSFRVFDTLVKESLLRERLMASLAGPFGSLAVILTALGLYGVTSYTVAQRTNEIGIRMALGADRRGVMLLIMRETAVVLALGLCAGTLLTLAAGRAAAALLFGLTASDPLSLTIASASLTLVAAGASYLPARRAASVDPAIALRQE